MDPNLSNILEPKEKVVWQGIVNRKVLNTFLIISLAITLGISWWLFATGNINYTSNNAQKQVSGSTVGIAVLIIGLIISLWPYFAGRVKEYAITQKRVLIKSGLIGTDFKSVYFDQIKNVIVDVGLIGKIFGVGSIKIDVGKTETYSTGGSGGKFGSSGNVRTRTMYDTLSNIDNPYKVYKYFQGTLRTNKESLYSGRADRESNPEAYK